MRQTSLNGPPATVVTAEKSQGTRLNKYGELMADEEYFDVDEETAKELLQRDDAADKEPKYSLEESRRRTWQLLAELRSLKGLKPKDVSAG